MFEILCNDICVGSAKVEKVGLYYRIYCVCQPPTKNIHRVVVSDGAREKDLGICVPSGTRFTLTARVPVKDLLCESLSFTLVTGKARPEYTYVPVNVCEPFSYLDKLETARLQETDGQLVILIDQDPVPQDNGQSLEHHGK